MATEPQKLLWQASDENFAPCLRIKFRLLLSWNDLSGEKWQKAEQTALWKKRGQERFIERMRELGKPVEYYRYYEEYKYKGQKKTRLCEGFRLKEVFFRDPVVLIARYWRSNNDRFDCDNLQLKPVIDGMVTGGLLPDDNDKFLPGVFRWFEGIDASFALSNSEIEARKRIALRREVGGHSRALPPPPNKMIYLDFYRLERLLPMKFFTLQS